MKASKQVKTKPKAQPEQPRELTRAEALKIVLQAADHAADAGAFSEFRPEWRIRIRASIELLKQPEPEPEPESKPCEGCDEKAAKPAKK